MFFNKLGAEKHNKKANSGLNFLLKFNRMKSYKMAAESGEAGRHYMCALKPEELN
jgi:hypothetical protein